MDGITDSMDMSLSKPCSLRDGGSWSPGWDPSLMLISPPSGHRGRSMPRQHPKAPLPVAGSASCTPRAGPAGGTRGPACEGPVCQSLEPDCRPGGQQRCWGALSSPPLPEHRREGGHVAPSWTQVVGGNPCGPALDKTTLVFQVHWKGVCLCSQRGS